MGRTLSHHPLISPLSRTYTLLPLTPPPSPTSPLQVSYSASPGLKGTLLYVLIGSKFYFIELNLFYKMYLYNIKM